jgi:hypothetical protein
MVYLTGDTHGDIQRFKQGKLRWLGKKDTVVVLGDFGFVWDGSAAERKRLEAAMEQAETALAARQKEIDTLNTQLADSREKAGQPCG